MLTSRCALTTPRHGRRGTDDPDGTLFFNLGVLSDDLGRDAEAIELYRQAIMHEPGLAQAHFNLSRLYEIRGHEQAAFRHLLFNARARVQEVLNFRTRDIVSIHPRGKGEKMRLRPLSPRTASLLRDLIAAQKWTNASPGKVCLVEMPDHIGRED
jgi:hypothetical protein